MTADGPENQAVILEIPKTKRTSRKTIAILLVGGVLLAALGVLGKRSSVFRQFSARGEKLTFVNVDQGDIVLSVVENGTVESSNNTTVRCEVEALMGKVGGSEQAGAGAAGTQRQGGATNGQAGGSTTGGSGSTSTSGGAAGAKGAGGAATKNRSITASSGAAGGTAAGGSSAGGSSSGSTASSGGSSGASASSTSGTGTSSGSGSTSGFTKPTIRSFAYQVVRHTPMRSTLAKATTTTSTSAQSQGGSRGGGSRGGSRGGRRGGSSDEEEKPGSTRIVWILPEGSHVKGGDLVCELDASMFLDEVQAQRIRYVQAKAMVEQVQAILEVNEITYREYRDGILPQDKQLILQYITTCRIQKDQAERTLIWSRDVTKKGFRAPAQLTADEFAYKKSTIYLEEAEGMLSRLEKYTAPKILKTLEANLKAIRADKLAQQVTLDLEEKRLRDLEINIKRCKLLAPHEGIVVYANETNRWGRVTDVIESGVTVREGQPIFSLPDPLHMRIKAKINETMINYVQTGQKAKIFVDAYPDHVLDGVVAEINPISSPGGMTATDVRVYSANINIVKGFDELRPGMSVEIALTPERRDEVTRVPIDSLRWIGDQAFVAIRSPITDDSDPRGWSWKRVRLGLFDAVHAEVLDGVKVGDRVVANPINLPAPTPIRDADPERKEQLATASVSTTH
jgi:multidrug resistance efflux pump